MPSAINFDEVGRRLLQFCQKLVTSLKTLWKNLLTDTEKYIRGKTKHMPEVLPKGRKEMVESILEHKHHQEFLQKFAQDSGIALDHVEATFRRYLQEIAADLNYLTIPFWDFFLSWIFGILYEGFDIDTSSLEKIRKVLGKKPVVFVPNHRSHVDYLLLSYICYNHGIPVPHVCAGTNLSFWPLGPIFRKSGGFFIRRSYEGNKLYAAAVGAYTEELIREKVPVEFFIEGGRSRTGKLLPPKMGILSAIVGAFSNKAAGDILFVPTSLSYESVVEDKNYISEQAGAAKKEENFWDLLRLQKYLRGKKGKVYIRFGEPISLKEFLEGGRSSDRREGVRQLAYEITYGINKSTVVTPASLAATALLTHEGRSLSGRLLQEKIEGYLDYLRFKECSLSEPLQKFQKTAIQKSFKNYVRSHLVQEYFDEGEPLYVVREERRPLLDYYKNTSIHFFVSMGVLITILASHTSDEIPFRKVEEDYGFLQELLQYEFTFSRRQSLRIHLEKLISYLGKKELARFEEPSIHLAPGARQKLQVFSSPLRNVLEGYSILWQTFPLMGARRWEMKDLIKLSLNRGWVLYLKEAVSRYESVNKFILQNAVWAFRDLGLLKEEMEGLGKRKRTFYTVKESGETIGKKLRSLLGKYHT